MLNLISQDTFTAANSTLLTEHTPELGPGWTAVGGTMEIQSNKARRLADSPRFQMNYDEAYTNAIIEATFRYEGSLSSGTFGVLGRLSVDGGTRYSFQMSTTTTQLRRIAGGGSNLVSAAFIPVADTDYTLRMELTGDNIKCYRNDALIFDVTNAEITTGVGVGFYLSLATPSANDFSAQADIIYGPPAGGLWLPRHELLGPDLPITPYHR